MLALGFALKTLQGCAVTKGDSVTLCNEHGGETPLRMPSRRLSNSPYITNTRRRYVFKMSVEDTTGKRL